MGISQKETINYKIGTEPNIRTVGSFANIDKNYLASGFSSTNYIKSDIVCEEGTEDWELVLYVKPNAITDTYYIIGTKDYKGPLLGIVSSKFNIHISGNGSSWTIASNKSGTHTLTAGVWYRAVLAKVGIKYSVSFTDMSTGIEYPDDIVVESTLNVTGGSPFYLGYGWTSKPGNCDIDLTKSSYKGRNFAGNYTRVGYWFDKAKLQIGNMSSSIYPTTLHALHESNKPWEAVIKIHTGALSANTMIIGGTSKFNSGVSCWINTSKNMQVVISSNGSSWNVRSEVTAFSGFTTYTDYWFKIEFTTTAYNFYYSTDGKTWSNPYTVASTAQVYSNGYWVIGSGRIGGDTWYTGTDYIQLDECYIKVDGKYWWTGCKLEKAEENDEIFVTKTDKKFYIPYTEHFDYYKYINEVNGVFVGTWCTDINGILSGFTTENFITLDLSLKRNNNAEYVICFTTNSTFTDDAVFHAEYFANIEIKTSGAVQFYNWKAGSSTTLFTAEPNTTYFVKILVNGTTKTYSYSTDGVNFVGDITITDASLSITNTSYGICLGRSSHSAVRPFKGTINLNKCYIKEDGILLWNGYPYNKRGNWIENTKIQGFSASNYIKTPDVPKTTIYNYEIQLKFYANSFNDGRIIGNITTNVRSPQLEMPASGATKLWYGHPNSDKWIGADLNYTLTTKKWYWFKVYWDGAQYTTYISENGTDWTQTSQVAATTHTWTEGVEFGADLAAYAIDGMIDFSECYIKFNNRLWWEGKKAIKSDKNSYDYVKKSLKPWAFSTKDKNIFAPFFESSTGGTYSVTIPEDSIARIAVVGGGGACALRGVYDDRGYGWGGGSGGAFVGVVEMKAGTYEIVVGKANNNNKSQGGNTNTLNPADTTKYDSSISGIVVAGGGGSGHYSSNYVGEAGAAPILYVDPILTTLNTAGNVGKYNSGGKGSSGSALCAGGDSVYWGYGKGQGGYTSEYANGRSWVNGSAGLVRIELQTNGGRRIY